MSDTTSAPAPKPGYLTTEFWGTVFVHLLALASFILSILHIRWHDPGLATLIPVAALFVSAIAQAAYSDKRLQLKMEAFSQWGRVEVAKAEHHVTELQPAFHTLEHIAPTAEKIVDDLDPSAEPLVADANKVAETVETDAKAGEQKVLGTGASLGSLDPAP